MKNILLFTLLLFCFTSSNAQILNGLVSKYSFDNGTANDEIGSNHGTIHGAILTEDRFGNPNKAYYFDGIDDYLDLGTSSTLKPVEATISLWIKMDSISNSGTGYNLNPIFFTRNTSPTNYYIEGYSLFVQWSDRKLRAITTNYITTPNQINAYGDSLYEDNWKHVVITYNDDSLSIFEDGMLTSRLHKGFTSTFSATDTVFFAKVNNNFSDLRYFWGTLDDIQIFNRVLSDSEIITLFNAQNPITSISGLPNNGNVITIYPNPSHDLVTFSKTSDIKIYTQSGSLIKSILQTNSVNISDFPSGIYNILFLSEKGGIIQQSRIIKK